jgi:hypothetical protein
MHHNMSPPTLREGPQKPYSRLSEGDLCTILQANFAEFIFSAPG